MGWISAGTLAARLIFPVRWFIDMTIPLLFFRLKLLVLESAVRLAAPLLLLAYGCLPAFYQLEEQRKPQHKHTEGASQSALSHFFEDIENSRCGWMLGTTCSVDRVWGFSSAQLPCHDLKEWMATCVIRCHQFVYIVARLLLSLLFLLLPSPWGTSAKCQWD